MRNVRSGGFRPIKNWIAAASRMEGEPGCTEPGVSCAYPARRPRWSVMIASHLTVENEVVRHGVSTPAGQRPRKRVGRVVAAGVVNKVLLPLRGNPNVFCLIMLLANGPDQQIFGLPRRGNRTLERPAAPRNLFTPFPTTKLVAARSFPVPVWHPKALHPERVQETCRATLRKRLVSRFAPLPACLTGVRRSASLIRGWSTPGYCLAILSGMAPERRRPSQPT